MYIQRTYKAAQTIAVHKTYSRRHDPGLRREEGEGNTPAAMAKYNRKMRERELAWVLAQNFRGGIDAHVTFTYPKNKRPPPEIAKKDFAQAIATLRKATKGEPESFKWVRALGIGERGGIHMHMATNCTNLKLLQEAWPHGGIYVTPLFANGDFAGLAKYFTDQEKVWSDDAKKWEGSNIKIMGRWSGSRNLIRQPPKEEKIGAFRWQEPPRPPKGYIIDVDSIDAGENPYTGLPYLFYRMVAITPPGIPKAAREERMEYHIRRAQQYIEETRQKNTEDVRRVWAEKCRGMKKQKPKKGDGGNGKANHAGRTKKGARTTPRN